MNDRVVKRPLRDDVQPIRCFLEVQPRVRNLAQQARHRDVGADRRSAKLSAIRVAGEIFVFGEAVQEARMSWVNSDLQRLQPITRPQTFEGKDVTIGRSEAVEPGERRRLAWTQVGPDNPAAFNARIGWLPNLPIETATSGFCWLLQAGACGVIEPTMKRAA